jgi:hypothetical protein
MTFLATASGLIMEKVRSIAMQNSVNNLQKQETRQKTGA